MSAIETVSALICRVGELPSLTPEQDMYLAGLESVRALEVLLDLEAEFEVTIPDEEFMQCRTAESLAALMTRLQQGA